MDDSSVGFSVHGAISIPKHEWRCSVSYLLQEASYLETFSKSTSMLNVCGATGVIQRIVIYRIFYLVLHFISRPLASLLSTSPLSSHVILQQFHHLYSSFQLLVRPRDTDLLFCQLRLLKALLMISSNLDSHIGKGNSPLVALVI